MPAAYPYLLERRHHLGLLRVKDGGHLERRRHLQANAEPRVKVT